MRDELEALRQRVKELQEKNELLEREIKTLHRIQELLDKNRHLEQENSALKEKVLELYTFWNISKALSSTLNLDELFKLAIHFIGKSLRVDEYSIMLLDEEKQELAIKASFGIPEEVVPLVTFKLGEGIPGLVVRTGEPKMIQDISREAEPVFHPNWITRAGSLLSVPLLIKGKKVIGVLSAHKPESHGFSQDDLYIFTAVANQEGIAIENARLYQRTKELSIIDDLTGLYNRRYFFDHLEKEIQRAKRYNRIFSVVILDIDYFKFYNDRHGHLRGDEILRDMGRILKKSTRQADVVARYGGEEFIVLLPETDKIAAKGVAEKIRVTVEMHPFHGRETQPGGKLTITLGVGSFPIDATEGLPLVDYADRALYLGKTRGRNQVCSYHLVFAH